MAADAGNVYAWFNLGSGLTAAGRYEEAEAAYERAIDLNPNYRSAIEALASLGDG